LPFWLYDHYGSGSIEKKVFYSFPGFEQEYLAEIQTERLVPYATQTDFKMEDLAKIEDYRGLPQMNSKIDWENLFQILKNQSL
jgi:hypothetical protein